MIKRTLYFSNPCTLKRKDMQMQICFPSEEMKEVTTVPVEDIGLVILDNSQILISHALMMALTENNTVIISCDSKHMPSGLLLPMFSHHAFTEKLHYQIKASQPLIKNLWQQTIIAKIKNQSALLFSVGAETKKMEFYASSVRSGDTANVEGRAAAYYWNNLFGSMTFLRDRFGDVPNNFLNYGYSILRAIVARALLSSGLFPSLGIHHRNKYNPYCLADDIMEPFRPYVDSMIIKIIEQSPEIDELTPEIKKKLLQIPVIDVFIDGNKSPLMAGVQRTTASLASCFEGTTRKILYPEML